MGRDIGVPIIVTGRSRWGCEDLHLDESDVWHYQAIMEDAGLRCVAPRESNPFAQVFHRKCPSHPNLEGPRCKFGFILMAQGGSSNLSLQESHRRCCIRQGQMNALM